MIGTDLLPQMLSFAPAHAMIPHHTLCMASPAHPRSSRLRRLRCPQV